TRCYRDWSSDVCSSDLWLTNTNFHCGCFGNLPRASSAACADDTPNPAKGPREIRAPAPAARRRASRRESPPALESLISFMGGVKIGRASCREGGGVAVW